MSANNSPPMDKVNKALGVGMGDGPRHANVEIKYTGPNGEMIDVSEHGWSAPAASTRQRQKEKDLKDQPF